MADNVKLQTTAARIPASGWEPHTAADRLLSQLDASTGKLTGDQQRHLADLPAEDFSEQPSTSHKIVQTADGAAEYRSLVMHNGAWRDPVTGSIIVNGAVRP
jgi:hypothetical protein